ncbi:helix-turn-helix domain-containing protein [Paenibacillus sp. 2TAB23]|uniref:helix-turn-helix domain-containing protein n=1 Tax=Paenibacillus sp. 2TAB23 TaxID=3233004 RepID=UPI003F967F9A
MNIGNRLAALRAERKWTQLHTSAALGISRAALSHYEKNRREPDSETLLKFANLFQVTVDYLVGRTSIRGQQLTDGVRNFVDQLELSDDDLLNKYQLTIDGRVLTAEETKWFINFVRAERLES